MKNRKNSLLSVLIIFLLISFLQVQAQEDLNLQQKLGKIDSANIFVSKDNYTWCSSVIKGDDNKYYMFYSRWPHGKRALDDDSLNYIFDGFAGWQKYSEIAIAVSEKLAGPYKHITTVLKSTGKAGLWDRFTMHNPHIQKFDGYYYLYFISTAYDSAYTSTNAKQTKEQLQWMRYNAAQSIGVIKVKQIKDFINGNFKIPEQPIVSVDKIRTFEVVNNPSVTKGPGGKYYMMYKSRKPGGHMMFWWAVADKPDAAFTTISNVTSEPEMACEDPSMWYDEKKKSFYAVAKYFSNSKNYGLQFGSLVMIQSKDGKDWKFANHPEVSKRVLHFNDGSTQLLSHLERPFIYRNKNGIPIALFAAASFEPPYKGDILNVDLKHNTFNVCIPLK
jgi:hypothetical protein